MLRRYYAQCIQQACAIATTSTQRNAYRYGKTLNSLHKKTLQRRVKQEDPARVCDYVAPHRLEHERLIASRHDPRDKRQNRELVPRKQHAKASEWNFKVTVDERDPNSRNNQFGYTADKWEFLSSVVWPANFRDERGMPKTPEVYYCERDIKYRARKMWYVCEFVRGRNVDDALVQLRFVPRKGAVIMREILEEAKKKAYEECDIEHPSDMWISECETEDTMIVQGMRRAARGKFSAIKYRYCTVFVRLSLGEPPEDGDSRDLAPTVWSKMANYIEQLRERKIRNGM